MKNSRSGFTLFEVLVATLILALGILAVVQGRSNSMRNVIESEKIGIATQLAQAKMAEMELKYQAKVDQSSGAFDSLFSEEEGAFEEPFQDYSWKVFFRESKIKFEIEEIKALLVKFGMAEEEAEIQVQAQTLFVNNLNKALKNNFGELLVRVEWTQYGNKRNVPVVTHLVPAKPKLELTLDGD